ncbi:hypothetical protein [Rhizobium leguminosarum]|uniref:hypothetical protein n=1 Tax=Rhizobium leguminosarum TaxID=384 RepID=UPI0012BD0C63|nr:hypothetical protein [Rhizobium leguminosarum]
MTSKIDIRMIFADHFQTFRDEATAKLSAADIAVMAGVPAMIAGVCWYLKLPIKDEHVGTLVSVFAIFGGLLFNILVLIYSFADRSEDPTDVRSRLVLQAFANISYSVLLCLVAVVLLTALLFATGQLQALIEALIYFVLCNFFLTMLMVLKRVHVLLREKFTY